MILLFKEVINVQISDYSCTILGL